MDTTKKSSSKSDTLYCRNFPRELKQRCEGLAAFLGKNITQFVSEILDEETRDAKQIHDDVKQWYESRKKRRNR